MKRDNPNKKKKITQPKETKMIITRGCSQIIHK